MGAPDSVYELVEKFDRDQPDKEDEVQQYFVDPLFEALGWNMRDKRQVRHEPSVIVKEAGFERSKRADYSFHIGNTRHFFVETKMPHVNLERNPIPAFQLRRYGWSGNTPVSVLTDFEEFSVYDCRIQPRQSDPASTARLTYYRYDEYIDKWAELEARFSREAVASGALREWVEGERARGFFRVDQAFLREMEDWRELLAQDIALHKRGLSQRQLNNLVQRTIDRIVFLRIAEDRNIEAYGSLRSAASDDKQVYEELKILFKLADDKYNSGLFHFGKDERDSEPDRLSLAVHIPDEPLRRIIKNLYFPFSPYEFSVLPADILGQVYERFLGKVIELSAGGAVRVADKPEVRKAGGVYYTPTTIVDYIVENTVGKLLEGKSPDEAAQLRILDPACGSGSFLVGAYQYLLDWHLAYYREHPRQYRNRRRETADGMILTTAEKRRILQENIYGVDLDQNAVEVSKLSLLLKMLENESDAAGTQTLMFSAGERILPDLSGNIKWGNSLVGSDFFRGPRAGLFDNEEAMLKVKAFDWASEDGFGDIMAAGGFDAVIGNPPWGSKEVLTGDELPYIATKYKRATHNLNIFAIFIDECLERLLADGGRLGFLIPKNFTKTAAYKPYREDMLAKHSLNLVVDFGQFPCVAQEAVGIFVTAKQAGANQIRRIYVENNEFTSLDALDVEDIRKDKFRVITLARMPNLSPIARKMESISFALGDKFEVGRGLEHGRKGDLIRCPHCGIHFERPGKRNRSVNNIKCKSCRAPIDISTTRHDETFIYKSGEEYSFLRVKGLLIGSSIDRYRLKEIPYKVDLEVPGINYKDLHHMKEKLYFIRISKSLRGYLDTRGLVALNALNFVYKSDDTVEYALQYVLGILNSKLLKSYVEFTVTGGANLTIRLSNAVMRSIPIRTIDFDNPADVAMHDKMVTLVDEMLDRHRQLPGLTGEARKIAERLIETVDSEIDALVYRLYGLSEDEVANVEGG